MERKKNNRTLSIHHGILILLDGNPKHIVEQACRELDLSERENKNDF